MNKQAFTIVEMMIGVAIIGILTVVATPAYRVYKRTAIQTEAKVNLAAAYSSERSFTREYNTYTLCLKYTGFVPTSVAPHGRRYFLIGSNARSPAGCSPDGNRACNEFLWNKNGNVESSCTALDARYSAQATLNPGTLIPSTLGDLPREVNMTTDTFVIGATGAVFENENLWDDWTINHQGVLQHLPPRVAPRIAGSDGFFQEI